MLIIPNWKSVYYLKDDDLTYICYQFNMFLCIIYETSDYTNTLVLPNRENIGILINSRYLTDYPRQFNNLTIITTFPGFHTIKKHIDHFLYERFDRLKISQQNPIIKNKTDFNINNNKPIYKSTVWYSQYCQDCEKLPMSQNDLNNPENNENEKLLSEGGDIMFCERCGNYLTLFELRRAAQYSGRTVYVVPLSARDSVSVIKLIVNGV